MLLIAVTLIFFLCLGVSVDIEDKLETEIDPREPRSFTQRQYKVLSVRQDGFKQLVCTDEDGKQESTYVPNWEVFSARYWYEYRKPNCTCPMEPRGIATMVDWSLMVPCLFGNINKPPRTVFVHNYFLPHFVESTLNFMDPSYRFVLITGGSDLTIPRSVDVRYHPLRGFASGLDGGKYYQKLLSDPRIIHWFCENHDLADPKLSTLPGGMVGVDPDSVWSDLSHTQNALPLTERPLKFMVSDKIRTGTGQWATRAKVAENCMHSSLCMRPSNETEVPHKEFLQHMVSVPFIACVHGGGLDPSPKALEAILHGTIPIIENTVLRDAYEKFPVMFVDDWSELFGNPENVTALLQSWMQKLAPYYEKGSELREKTIDKLKANYWMEQVYHHVKKYDEIALGRANSTSTGSTQASRHQKKLIRHKRH